MPADAAAPHDPAHPAGRSRRIHPAWLVFIVGFLALLCAAGFRAAPGALIAPIQAELAWPTGELSLAVSVNLLFYGFTAPFAAALMDRFGVRRVVAGALSLVALGAGGSVLATESWMLIVFWGLLIGLGTGSMALVFADTIASRWFVTRRGLVMGTLAAGQATGQLIFLPPVAAIAETSGWRPASLLIAAAALVAVPLVLLVIRDHPEDHGVLPFGWPEGEPRERPRRDPSGAVRRALGALRTASRRPAFWALAGAFAICGATTNGLVGLHFIPSAHDHGMPQTVAAGLLAVVGLFDVVGTIVSGWLTDRFDPRKLLAAYYLFRGVGLVALPNLLGAEVQPSMLVFVAMYGLDWVATVPPTSALCRERFGKDGTIVFGWIFASHQVGAAIAAFAAGVVRDQWGSYTAAWLGGAALCVVATVLSLALRRHREPGEGAGSASGVPPAAPSPALG